MPTNPAGFEPEDGSGSKPSADRLPAGPSHATPVARARILTGGFLARHPTVSRVLEWLGWNSPGGSMNP
jgi:hypothetical protein